MSLSPIEKNCALINNNNCTVGNPEIQTLDSDVLTDSNVNNNIHSVDNEVHDNTVYVPLSQPWSIENAASVTITNNLSLRSTTSILSRVCDNNNIMSNVIIEPSLPAVGPLWPAELISKSLVSVLLAHPSNIYVRIKKHTRNVHKFMQFLNDGTSSMLVGVTDAYNKLNHDLNKLLRDSNSSENKNHPVVVQCCTLIHQLIDETFAIYIELTNVQVNSNVRSLILEKSTD